MFYVIQKRRKKLSVIYVQHPDTTVLRILMYSLPIFPPQLLIYKINFYEIEIVLYILSSILFFLLDRLLYTLEMNE